MDNGKNNIILSPKSKAAETPVIKCRYLLYERRTGEVSSGEKKHSPGKHDLQIEIRLVYVVVMYRPFYNQCFPTVSILRTTRTTLVRSRGSYLD